MACSILVVVVVGGAHLDGAVPQLPAEALAPGPHVARHGYGDGVVAAARDGEDGDALERRDQPRGGAVGVGAQAQLAPGAAAPGVEIAGAVQRDGVVVAGRDGFDVVEAIDEGGDAAALVALANAELPVSVASAGHDDPVVCEEERVVLAEGAHADDAPLQGSHGVWDVK